MNKDFAPGTVIVEHLEIVANKRISIELYLD